MDFASISYLNSGSVIDFVDGTKWTNAAGGAFDTGANWAGGVAPTATVNGIFDLNSTYTVTVPVSTAVRTLGVSNGNVTFDVATGQTLTLANDGYLFADTGATLSVTGAGAVSAAVVDAIGAVNLATVTDLSGGSVPHPVRDGTNPLATSRYGLVVEAGGTVNLLSGADVTVSQTNKNVGIRVGEGMGTGTLSIATGASLEVGNTDSFGVNGLTSNGFIVVGDFGSTGVVNQTGGAVLLTDGSFNLGNQGGTGTWSISDGSLTLAGGLHSLGRNTGSRAAGTGTLNLSGTALMEVKASLNNGPASFVVGDRDDSTTDGFGIINQTGGTLRVEAGSYLFLGGHGSSQYNLNGGTLEVGGSSLRGLYQNAPGGSYAFNLGGGTIKVIGSDLSTSVNAATVASTASIIDTNGFNANWSGNLSGSGILNKTGTGTLTLTGTNSITGEFYVTGGEVAQTTGTSGIKYYAVGSGAGNTGVASLSSGTLNVSQALQVGDYTGTGTFNQTGGTINVAGPVVGASLNIGNQGGNGTYNLSGGQLNLGGVNGGLYSLGRATGANPGGVGEINISGTSVLEVQSGGFIIGDRDASGAEGRGVVTQTGGTFRVNSGASLYLGGYAPTIGGTNTYNLNGGTLEIGGNSLVPNYNGSAPYAFNLGGGTIKVIGSSLTTAANAALTAATTSKIDTNGFNATLSGTLSGAGALEKQGTGKLELTANNSYTGATTVTGGTLQLGNGGTTGSIDSSASVSIASGATLKTNRSNAITLSQAITGAGNVEIANASTGTTALTSASNTYTGTTIVSGGALQVGSGGSGTTGTGDVSVASGSTILGSGVVQGSNFTANNGSTIRPGDSVADSSHGTLIFTPASASGATHSLQGSIILGITGATTTLDLTGVTIGSGAYNTLVDGVAGVGSHDRLVFNNPTSGTGYTLNFLTTSGSLQVVGSSFTPHYGDVFNLMDWSNLVTANFTGFSVGSNRDGSGDNGSQFDLPDISGTGWYWDVSRFTTSGNIIVVPEPSRTLLLLLGMSLLVSRRRRGV